MQCSKELDHVTPLYRCTTAAKYGEVSMFVCMQPMYKFLQLSGSRIAVSLCITRSNLL